MFKKFKDKLAEEMKQSPARLTASMQQLAQAVVSPGLSNASIPELTSSNDNFSLTEEGDDTPKNSPARHNFQSVDLTSPSSNSMGLSRASSVNSVTSADTSGLFPIYESPGNMYHLQSDMDQSASEADECAPQHLDQVSKEQIYSAYRKVQTKYHKYRGRYTDLANHYRELERVKFKLESLLVETQDKALRRIADLKEQCQLEQQAKAHLEDALRNDIEEKDHIIDTLNTKVRLLQANGSSLINFEDHVDPIINKDDTENHNSELVAITSDDTSPSEEDSTQLQLTAENLQLKNKLEKLETLLSKYKDSLKRSKDKMSDMTEEKCILERNLDTMKNSTTDKLKALEQDLTERKEEILQLNEQINAMKKREEECVISLAENKLSIHRELEIKEEQIKQLTLELKNAVENKENIQVHVEDHDNVDSSAREEVKMLEEKLSEARGDVDNYEREIEELKSELARTKEELEINRSEMKERSNKEMTEKSQELSEQEQTIQTLNSKIQVYVATLQKAKDKIEAQNAKIKQLAEEQLANENSEKIKIELESKNLEVLGLQSELKSCRGTINDLRERINENLSSLDQLKKQKRVLLTNIVNYMTIIRSLKSNCDELKSQMKDLEGQQRNELSDVCKLVLGGLNNYDTKIATSIDETSKLQTTIEDLNEQIVQNNCIEKELRDKNEEMRNILQKLEEENKIVKKKYEESVLEMENQRSLMEEANVSTSMSREETDKLHETIKDLNDRISQNNFIVQELRDNNEEGMDNLKKLNEENKILKEKYEETVLEIEKQRSLMEEAIASTSMSREETDKLHETIKDLNDRISQNNFIIQELRDKNAEATDYLKNLEEENKILKKEHEEAVSEITKQRNDIEKLEKDVELFKEEVAQQKEKFVECDREKEILRESTEKSKALEEECRRLNEEINEKTTNFDEKLSIIISESDLTKSNLQESEGKLKDLLDKYTTITEENLQLQSNITSMEAKFLTLNNEKSELNAQLQNFMDIVQAKNEFIDKLRLLKKNQTKIIDEINIKLENIQTENGALKEMEKSSKVEEENIRKDYLGRIDVLERQQDILRREHSIVSDKCQELEERLTISLSENRELTAQVKQQQEISIELENKRQELNTLMLTMEELRRDKETAEIERKELKDAKNELLKSNEELRRAEESSKQRVQELEKLLESHSQDITTLKAEIQTKANELEEKESWARQIIEELKNQLEKLQADVKAREFSKEDSNKSEEKENRLKEMINELQTQLQDKDSILMTCQATQSQVDAMNEELKIEAEKLRQQLTTSESEQTVRMKEMVKEFQAKLHDKDEELQAALDKKFDRQKNYESDLVQQYKEQLKDFQIELTAKSEQIESLKQEKSSNNSGEEFNKLLETIENLKIEHENELKDIETKWKDTIKQQNDELETKHAAVVNELTKEWKKNQLSDEKSIENNEELESMSKVAMAAVESNTGSFHSLQQTLTSQRRELTELRKLVKLRHETLEDSTEIEYLRNILYEYMMGKETLVLARVIAAVVKFDQEQTTKILKKEEDKLTLLGSLGLT